MPERDRPPLAGVRALLLDLNGTVFQAGRLIPGVAGALEADVGGGQAVGLRGVLVRTGKFRADDLAHTTVRPDAVIESLAEISRLL
jgi:ribonucleotide monophosphatase NagD (HAD superfamily)